MNVTTIEQLRSAAQKAKTADAAVAAAAADAVEEVASELSGKLDTTGTAAAATKLATARAISLAGDATGSASFDGSAAVSIATTLASSGVTAGSYGPSANATPAAGGTFSVPQVTVDAKGRVTGAAARTITIPAAPTSVSGNAGTATKLATARTISLTGDATGSASFDGSANASITATLAASGATAGSYGPTAAASPGYGGTFTVPQVTVDAKGRVTGAAARTITMPATQTTVTGNAGTATKLATARTIALTGAVTGSASFDGSANASVTTSINFTAADISAPVWSAPTTISIATSSWVECTDETMDADGYNYMATVSVSGITAACVVSAEIGTDSRTEAQESGIANICLSGAGTVQFYARTAPDKTITMQISALR